MKFIQVIILSVFLLMGSFAQSQITITSSDVPVAGKVYETQTSLNTNFNYQATGANQTWSIKNIGGLSNANTAYVSGSGLPLLLRLQFNPQPNLARKLETEELLPDSNPLAIALPAIDFYNLFRINTNEFSNLGFGAVFQGFPVVGKYDKPDVLYKFPLTYKTQYTDSVNLNFSLIGFFETNTNQRRTCNVEAYGTLETDYGTYEVIRLVTDVKGVQSFSRDTGQQSINFHTRTYEWIAKGIGIPVLTLNGNVGERRDFTPLIINVLKGEVKDTTIEDTNKVSIERLNYFEPTISYSTDGNWLINMPDDSDMRNTPARLMNMEGKLIDNYFITEKQTSISYEHLPKGIYLLKIGNYSPIKLIKF